MSRVEKRVALQQSIVVLTNPIVHHRAPIQHGGALLNMENLFVVVPRYHKEILNPGYPY